MKKTIGVLAHVDAGKTTFCEQVLYHTKSIRNRGRVDHKDSFLDNHEIERNRGITIFSEQAIFEIDDCTYYLIDTPGHIDFSSEMERNLSIMDYGILIISAVEGVQGHTKTVWNLLRKNKIPTIIFVNKLDRVNADKEKVLDNIRKDLSKDVFYFDEEKNDFKKDNIKLSNEVIEKICEYDDGLMEKYFDDNIKSFELLSCLKNIVKDNKFFPCFGGSALLDEGIENFLNAMHEVTFTDYAKEKENKKFAGRVYKIRYDNNERCTFVKCLSGQLKVKDEIKINGEIQKINAIRTYNGNKFNNVNTVSEGEIFALVGLKDIAPGDGIGELEENITYSMIPTLTSKAIFDESNNIKEVLNIFKILEEEDPSLNVIWNEKLGEIHIHIMGKIELEVLTEILKTRFNLDVQFGKCNILYKETIGEESIGRGHFEPLRHYAEVHLKLKPLPRGEGIKFKSECHTDNLNYGQQNLIKTHIFEREHHGILTGSSLSDVEITLLTGRAHNKHTSGGDFRQATFRAIRQGLEKVENILLEPYYKFSIEVFEENIGRVLSDIQKLHGEFEPVKLNDGNATIEGRGPVSTFMDYSTEVTTFTRGKGSITLMFDGYDICHNTEEVIEEIGYNKEADIEYTSSSIFCSHGQGYVVKWNECDKEMHCEFC